MKLIIEKYSGGEITFTMEFPEQETFQEVTWDLVYDLRNLSTTDYMTNVLTKWFEGRHFADSSPGDEKPFDIREYDGPVGAWTDYLFRL